MLKSMTGFGRAFSDDGNLGFNVEIKSVNHRYLDLNIKLPRNLMSLEEKVRKEVASRIKRGKIDIFINQNVHDSNNVNVNLDKSLADSYFKCLKTIKDEFKIVDDISVSLIAKFPDVITVEEKDQDLDEVWNILSRPLDEALDTMVSMREKEGAELKRDIQNKCCNIEKMLTYVEERAPYTVEDYKAKLEQRIKDLLVDKEVDEARIAMEVAIFADKSCIDEEIVRLKSHIVQFKSTLGKNEPVGRKLDFIVQEMNREANTINSKSSDMEIVHSVLDIKNEIEKIREQIQNIE
ncbi:MULTISPECIES: YicC/YloC family endoribonuclease [Clostridium]|uniref:YicC/YloC family endoribonuclease n=1 Tax=Clostridium TaxID=1485 RepID=UPI0008266C6B|nr:MULTISPECIES: YicC/YloC family endoribonuclease [Clostridium]PJI06649.1 YicC family protein [Clostridium sp. CT7]